VTSDKKTLTLGEHNFEREVLESGQPVLVDFWASWCGPCHAVAPILDELAVEFDGIVTIGKVNVDEQRELAARYRVQSIPTMLLFEGGQIVETVIGAVPRNVLAEKLTSRLTATT
jgi:thioredoxin 1